jgi:FdhD protein
MVSGRGGFEIIQKALLAGIPLLASVSAPSSLAVRLAREAGMTLVGFLRGQRFLVYSGEERLQFKNAKASEGGTELVEMLRPRVQS